MSAIPKQTPWEIQRSVIFACFVRELNARFGRFQLGYFWALLEPIAYILISAAIRGRFTGSPNAGLPPVVFFASGVLPFFLFRNIASSSMTAVENNLNLFKYQRVKPVDVFAARVLLEVLISVSTAALLFTLLNISGQSFTFNSLPAVAGVVICLLGLACGAGLTFSMLTPLWHDSKRIVPSILRILFFISGCFFPANAIPDQMRDFALLNPLLHAIELLRGALFTDYTSHEGDWRYLAGSALAAMLIGLITYRWWHVKIVTSGYIKFR